MTIPPSPESRRLRGIDALRGVAALGVVLFHAVDQSKNALPNNLFDYPVRLVQSASSFGYIGVFLFFVISGFCIHLQWARAKAAGTEPDIRFGSFWKRRIRRLYPPYVLALLLIRRRVLRVEMAPELRAADRGASGSDPVDTMQVYCPKREAAYEVRVNMPDGARVEEIQQQLSELLIADAE